MTSIEWTDVVWNPTTGCDRVSDGCDNCYALTMAKRLKGMGSEKYQTDGDPRTSGPGFGATMHPDALELPLSWRKPRRVFVNSMSDLFHEKFTDAFIAQVFEVMARTPQHTYQILTKRHARMRALLNRPSFRDNLAHWGGWPLPNVHLGVSTEDQKWADIRIPALLDTPAAVRWISAEPLLGAIELGEWLQVQCWCCDRAPGRPCVEEPTSLSLDWVVVGGESGPGARPMDPQWARSLRDQCVAADVPYLLKQWGGRTPKAGGRELDGRTWDQYPAVTG